jgi:hypothetical protein
MFVDPKGEEIELIGDEEAREKALRLLRQAVGEQAGAYLEEKKIVNKDGSVKYFVKILDGGPDGKGPLFEAINGVTTTVGRIIRDSAVVELSVVKQGTVIEGLRGEKARIGSLATGLSPGITSANGDAARVFILDPDQSYGSLPKAVMSDGRSNAIEPAVALAHELGHVAHAWAFMMGSSMTAAVTLENRAREIRDPNGPRRTKHEANERYKVGERGAPWTLPIRGQIKFP